MIFLILIIFVSLDGTFLQDVAKMSYYFYFCRRIIYRCFTKMNTEEQKRKNHVNLTKVGSEYVYSEEFGAPEGDPMNEALEALDLPLSETLTARGTVVYTDGEISIVRIIDMYQELEYSYALSYKEVKERYPDFEDPQQTQLTDYLCMDVQNQVSLFWRNIDDTLCPAIFDEEDHFFNGYDIPESSDNDSIDLAELNEKVEAFRDELLNSDVETRQQIREKVLDVSGRKDEVPKLDTKGFVISLPERTIKELEENDVIEEPFFEGISRARHWFLNKDCAILSTWRYGKTREQKNQDDKQLVNDLRVLGYGVIKVRGCYVDSKGDINKENSFLVTNLTDNSEFFEAIYGFSEKYEQESFIYKSKNNETAYLVGTSDEFKYGRGNKVAAGTLHINNMTAENFSLIGSGQISFE